MRQVALLRGGFNLVPRVPESPASDRWPRFNARGRVGRGSWKSHCCVPGYLRQYVGKADVTLIRPNEDGVIGTLANSRKAPPVIPSRD
jgi:hypothetical protein